MQIWAESGKSALPICNYSQILYQFLTFTQNLKRSQCRDLFEIIEARDCRKSTVIISQMPVANWYQLFGDNTYADACLSRMTSKAYRLDFPGRDRRVESK